MAIQRRRRTSAPKIASTTPETSTKTAPEMSVEASPAATKRRKRGSVGGFSQKLAAPTRPGFVRRWFNDVGNRLADAAELAYEFVSDASVKTHDPSSRIARRVGTGENGAPLHSYLMETPEEEYAVGQGEREAIHSQVDQAIVKGADFTGEVDEQFAHARRGSITIER